MRYVKAALWGFFIGIALGAVVGGAYAWVTFRPSNTQGSAAKASLVAAAISASLNCAALLASIGVLGGILIAAIRPQGILRGRA